MLKYIDESEIRIVPWNESDLSLLFLLNSPIMTEYLGGPETRDQVIARHKMYLDIGKSGTGQMFTIVYLPQQIKVGCVGYWEREWNKKSVYEIGWGVIPGYQGKGIATIAVTQAIAIAKGENKHKYIHAFPSIHNIPSNTICRKLNFSLISKLNFDYQHGNSMVSNNWRLRINKNVSK